METDPIIIRILAIDEATATISKLINSLKQLQAPAMNISSIMGNVQHKIVSVTKAAKEMVDPVKDFQKQISMMEVTPVENLNAYLQEAGISANQFTGFLKTNNMEAIKGVGVYDKLSGAIISQGQAVKLATLQLRRFKFEWLSVMFAGMALDRVFGALIQRQMQLWGVTEMTSAMWTIVMLPVMEKITPLIYNLLDAFMNLSPGMQEAIGWIVIFGAGLAKILAAAGQLVLFFMGLRLLMPTVFSGGVLTAIKGLITAIGGISLAFLAVVAVIALVLIGMYLAWKTNFLNMKQTVQNFIEGIKQIFGGIIDMIKGILMIIKGIFTGDFTLIKEGIIKIFKGIWDFLVGGFKAAFNLILGIIKGTLLIVYNIIKVLIDGVIWLVNAIGKLAGKKTDIIKFRMPTFQKGGIMPYTGVAYLHAGERVIPKGESSNSILFSPSVTINADISSDYDVRKLASELNQFWAKDFERALKGKI